MDRPILIGPDALHRPAAETPGVDRREAFADDHVWAGRSRTQAGAWSGWHVHPGNDTYVFQTQGRLRLEFGPGGTESVEGGPGDFVLIPKGVVHREGNPGTGPNEALLSPASSEARSLAYLTLRLVGTRGSRSISSMG